jgi:predicted nucleic acid-binding protein
MGLPTSSTDRSGLIVADTSAVINLNASGCAERIIRALPQKFVVVDVVPGELEEGRLRGRQDAELLRELVGSGTVEIATLDDLSAAHFEKLVVGPAVSTLEDGEAATIAYAISQDGIAVIDETKARRLCAEMFPELSICSTVDLFALPEVRRILGETALAEAVFQALLRGRMRVFPEHIEWVVQLIGIEKASACSSLPASARRLLELPVALKATHQ